MGETDTSRRVQILRDSVAKKIAAGEVIDRPYSVVRELLDNSIDAEAASIDLSIEKGGLKRIRVADDGAGMSREDLELAVRPHSTSKIETAEDIYALRTLGFRGEALSSIASCSRLGITSAPVTGEAYSLEVHEGEEQRISPSRGKKGTVVEAADIFYSMPGRRKFLKSAGAETSACKKTLLEKALPNPGVAFRFYKDGTLELNLPPATLSERVAKAYSTVVSPSFLYEIEETAGDFSLEAVLASPAVVRKDRRYIQIYVNGRRIQEFSLIQAVEYAYRAVLPGGSFPVAFLFLSVKPELVDFNIHPAKREAKIKNLSTIHHEVVERIGEFLRRKKFVREPDRLDPQRSAVASSDRANYEKDFPFENTAPSHSADPSYSAETSHSADPSFSAESSGRFGGFHRKNAGRHGTGSRPGGGVDLERLKQLRHAESEIKETGSGGTTTFHYRGQVFGVFLAAETGKVFYLIDQHAAHERIIYDRLLASSAGKQPLLVAHSFEIEEDEEKLLLSRLEEFEDLNISVEQDEPGLWKLNAVPENCVGMEKEIIEFLTSPVDSASSIQTELYADIACKRAVKEGEKLDEQSAGELIRMTFALPVPRCPHGRPVWIRMTEEEMYRRVGRL